MKLGKIAVLAAALAVFTAVACVTINVYFPEAAVRDLAAQIEEAVQEQASEGDAAEDEGMEDDTQVEESSLETLYPALSTAPASRRDRIATRLRDAVTHLLGSAPVYAQKNEVVAPATSNPAIRAIISSRGKRAKEIRAFKDRGVLGETNKARLEVRDLNSLQLKERAAVQKLVKAENADRETMFKEIAAATGTDLSQLPQIRSTYAETIREKAAKGDWVQLEDGSWRQK